MEMCAKLKSIGMKHTVSDEKNTSVNVIWNKLMKITKTKSHFVVCVDNSEYPASLELHKFYRLIPDKQTQADGDMRVIDESGEDYLFPADYFIPIDLPRTVVRVLNKSYPRPSTST